jgi:hypothetical protein
MLPETPNQDAIRKRLSMQQKQKDQGLGMKSAQSSSY